MTHYIICPYSKPEYLDNLKGALERQTFRDFIPIIVENGPAVGTFPRLEGYVILTSEAHQSHAKNTAHRWIRKQGDGSWSVFDCDDYYGPEYIQSQLDALEGYDIAGKSFSNMLYLKYDDGLYLSYPGVLDTTKSLTGGAITCRTAHVLDYPVIAVGEDGYWIWHMVRDGAKINHTGPRHYCYNRSGLGHTWSLNSKLEATLKKNMVKLGDLPIEVVNDNPRNLLYPQVKIARMVMLYTPDYAPAKVSVPDIQQYCKIWEYSLQVHTDRLEPSWPAAWNKILATLNALKEVAEGEWVMWMDADMVMKRYNRPLESLVDTDKDFMISVDSQGICTGLYLIRNVPLMREFFSNLLLDIRQEWPWEQDAMKDLLASRPDYLERVGHIPETIVQNPSSEGSMCAMIMHYWGNGYPYREGLLKKMQRDIYLRDSGRRSGRLFSH